MNVFNLNALQIADRLVLPKSNLGLIQHHAIYIGQDYLGNRLYIENAIGIGVQLVNEVQLFRNGYELTRIEHFTGDNYQRNAAVNLAWQLIGKQYDLLSFNCEHYANKIQHNKTYSNQVRTGLALGLLAIIVGIGLSE